MSQLKVNSIIPVAGVPTGGGGGIIQVISNTTKDAVGSISLAAHASGETNFVDIPNQNVTITPTSNTSKILISFFQYGEFSATNNGHAFIVKRAISGGATTHIKGTATGSRSGVLTQACLVYHGDEDSTPEIAQVSNYLDSPSTTSAVTYTVMTGRIESSTSVYYYNRSVGDANASYAERGLSWITVMEVSG
tara:strand:- start:31 stop:606 length:576 start_codon:yes stop_codon:yes gene_type:complete